jgi:exonuclease VII small subunit
MADLEKKLEDINKQIDILRSKLSKEGPFKQFEASASGINEAVEELNNLNDELDRFNDSLDDSLNSWRSIVSEAKTSSQLLNQNNNILSSSSSISQKISDHFKGINILSEKEAKNLQKSLEAQKSKLISQTDMLGKKLSELQYEKESLGNSENDLKRKQKINSEMEKLTRTIQNNNTLLKGGDKLYDQENNKLEKIQQHHKEINKELGFAPQLAAGLDNVLKKMGLPDLGVADALTEAKELGLEAKAQGKSFNTMAHFTGKLKDNFMGAFTKANLLQGAVLGLINGFIQSQKGIGDLAKGLGMSATRAADMRQEFANIANLSMDSNVNVKNLQEAQMAVGVALGTNAMLNEEDLITMAEIVKKTGLQYNELVGIQKLSLATGKSLDDNVKAALGGATAYASQNKLIVDNNKVLREVNSASSSLKLSLGGSVEALGEAVVKVQQLGMDLKTAEQIASSMLNFESSIEAELEAELLTGKNLNMERARQLALEGDIAGAAKEMADQLGSAEEFGKMNVIQQEALAKSIGLSRDALADSLIEREALAKMSMVEGETALERYNLLKAQNKSEAEIVALLGEKAAGQLEQQSAQEKFNASVEKLKEIFTQVMDALAPIFDVLSSIATVVMPAINLILSPLIAGFQLIGDIVSYISSGISSFSEWLSKGSAAATALKVVLYPIAAIVGVIAAGLIYASLAAIPVIGPALGAIAVVGMISMLAKAAMSSSSSAKKGNDIMSPGQGSSGYGKRTLMGPEGAIQLNNKDTVIAGTNLFGDDVKSEPGKATEMVGEGEMKATTSPTQTTQASVDMTQTNALLQQLISAVTTGGVVTLDGQKVGEALKIGSFQTQ